MTYSWIGLHHLRIKELATTLTEERAIAAAANEGGNSIPVNGKSTPIAKGIPIRLYTKAHAKLVHILRIVARPKSSDETASIRSLRTITKSAASSAISEPAPIANPILA